MMLYPPCKCWPATGGLVTDHIHHLSITVIGKLWPPVNCSHCDMYGTVHLFIWTVFPLLPYSNCGHYDQPVHCGHLCNLALTTVDHLTIFRHVEIVPPSLLIMYLHSCGHLTIIVFWGGSYCHFDI